MTSSYRGSYGRAMLHSIASHRVILIALAGAAAAVTAAAWPAQAQPAQARPTTSHAPKAETTAAFRFGQAVELRTPSLSYSGEDQGGLGCASPGNCVASVSYNDSRGNTQAYIFTETRGHWLAARQPVRLPSGAGRDPYAAVEDFACPRAGQCTGVGRYDTRYGGTRALVLTQVGGRWGRAQQITPPENAAAAPGAFLYGLSCPAPGSCEAVGGYTDRQGNSQAMAVEEIRGRWQQATEVQMPADAGLGFDVGLYGVACSRPGDCEAVGRYDWKGVQDAAAGATETGGHWGTAVQIQLPADAKSDQNLPPGSSMYGIACPRPDYCLAIGDYQVGNAYFSLTTVAEGRTWAPATPAQAMPRRGFSSQLSAIACPTARFCAAVGYVLTDGPTYPVALDWNGRRWARIPAGRLPARALTGRRIEAGLSALACQRRGSCEALGWYLTRSSRLAMAVPSS
jgi:hypothetical protein